VNEDCAPGARTLFEIWFTQERRRVPFDGDDVIGLKAAHEKKGMCSIFKIKERRV
jgi:hypothetical protein